MKAGASKSPPTAPPAPQPAGLPADPETRTLWTIVLAAALAYPIAYVAIALLRMRFPFELEWMEGGVLDHVRRVLAGQPLYIEPSLRFTPFIYPPLYFQLGAVMCKVMGVGFVPLRLLSFAASLGSMAFVYAIVRQRTQDRLPALLGACLFAATYRSGGAWLDLARVDSLHMCLMLAGVWACRLPFNEYAAGALGGLLFALAALTKQSALFVAIPLGLVLLAIEPRRGVGFAVLLGVVAGSATLMLDRASGGWYRFYVFDLPRRHPIIGQLLRGFWIQDLLGPFAIALTLVAFRFFRMSRSNWRLQVFDLTLLVALILTAYATKIRVGSYDNLLLPAHVAASLAFGWGVVAFRRWCAELPAEAARSSARLLAFLCLVQLALLAYKPWRQVPSHADVDAGNQFVASLERVQGDVWVPAHQYLAEMAGKGAWAHELAITDVLRPIGSDNSPKLMAEVRDALRERRFALIVLDNVGWLRAEAEPTYDHVANMFAATEPDLFWPVTGFRTRPDFVWSPKADSARASGR